MIDLTNVLVLMVITGIIIADSMRVARSVWEEFVFYYLSCLDDDLFLSV